MARPQLLTASFPILIVALSGCAATSRLSPEARASEILSSQPPPPGRTCAVVFEPAQLPVPAQLVDVENLTADILNHLAGEQGQTGYVLLSMGYDQFGTNIRRALIEHDLSSPVADSIQRLVFKHRRNAAPREAEWGVRLRIGLDEAVRFQVGRQEVCAPRPRDNQLARALESPFGTIGRQPDGTRRSTVWVRLLVNPQGSVSDAMLERGIVRNAMLEQRIMDWVRALFFEPALRDGDPVSGYISVPVVIAER